ncbi:MAG TPA: hypothetical protein VGT41_00825 [Candidatus Babeliales bacterium]|nr:hypothetical protein [Candidatus Babeliales bacterium]
MHVKHRNIYVMILLSVITGFLYTIYWVFQTKKEINDRGGNIPTIFLYLIPYISFIIQITISHFFENTWKIMDHSWAIRAVSLIFPILFWYIYITNFVMHVLKQNSLSTTLKWFFLTIVTPITLSMFVPILMLAMTYFILHRQDAFLEVAQYLQHLIVGPVTETKVIIFLLFQWLVFSTFLLIFCIPQFAIQYYLNKTIHKGRI